MASRRDPTSPIPPVSAAGVQWRAVPADPRPQVDLLGWVAWIAGGWLLVAGLVLLARAGFDRFDLFEPIVTFGPFQGTRLMALILIGHGAIIWYGCAGVPNDLLLRGLGALMLLAGIVLAIEPGAFGPWLGIERPDGIHHAAIGALLVVFSLIPPFKVGRPRNSDDG